MKNFPNIGFLILFASALLVACTFQGIFIKHADYFATREVDQAFDLSSEQKQNVRKTIKKVLAWTQNNSVPTTEQNLQKLQKSFAQPMTQQELRSQMKHFNDLRTNLIRAGGQDLEQFIATLTDDNIAQFEKYLAAKLANWKEVAASAKFKEKRLDRLVDQFERWFGDLSDDQVAKVGLYFSPDRNEYEAWIEDRKRMNQTLLTFLQENRTSGKVVETFIRWSDDPTLMQPDEKTRLSGQQRREKVLVALCETLNLMSSEQKTYAVKKVETLLNDFKHWKG